MRLVSIMLTVAVLGGTAFGQGAARDQGGAATKGAELKASSKREWFLKRFAGSYAELSTFVGTGSFYSGGFSRPYVAEGLYVKPTFQLGTPVRLTLNARVYFIYEFTNPDSPSAQRFSPLDTWIWLSAANLYTEKKTGIRLSGIFRVQLPTSYESIYSNTVMGLAAGLGLGRGFKWAKNWRGGVSLSSTFTKFFHTREYRGKGPGDSTLCDGPAAPPPSVATGAGFGPDVSVGDTCGGPLNTSHAVVSALSGNVGWKGLTISTTLLFINQWRYSFPIDQYTSPNAVQTGQVDSTWGLIALSYDINPHLGVTLGLSSFQPALNSTFTRPRFPFFDFESGNAANYTQIFANVNGTL